MSRYRRIAFVVGAFPEGFFSRPIQEIIDDLISTGGTIALAAKTMLNLGAKRVFAACTHSLLVGGAYERILSSGVEEIIATDTTPSPISRVSVAPIIAEHLKEILR